MANRERSDFDAESAVCDLNDMARITDIMMERLANEMNAFKDEAMPASKAIAHLDDWICTARFATMQMHSMTLKVRKDFYQSVDG